MLRVFVGWDSREAVAYHVLAHSILRRASSPVSVAPVMLSQVAGLYRRERGPAESTEFSISRFLVPWLSGFDGWSVFMDCDMLMRADVFELVKLVDPEKAVSVCKHDYSPRVEGKFLGHAQTKYPRKNWSSLMVFNNSKCQALTPDYVAGAPGLDLHRFAWLRDEEVGGLSLDWNWLVGEYGTNPDAKVLHFTLGGPWFPEMRDEDGADLWRAELEHMLGHFTKFRLAGSPAAEKEGSSR